MLKRHNWSVSIKFNSQLRVWVTGSGAMSMRGGFQQVHCFQGPTAAGLRQKDRYVTDLRHQEGKEFFKRVQFCLIMSNSF